MRLRILKNWGIVKEAEALTIIGNVLNHPHFQDGTRIATSTPIAYDPNERVFISTSGGFYALDTPDPSYITFCQDCVERTHKALANLKKTEVLIDYKGDILS